jgi:hypothetical protein
MLMIDAVFEKTSGKKIIPIGQEIIQIPAPVLVLGKLVSGAIN